MKKSILIILAVVIILAGTIIIADGCKKKSQSQSVIGAILPLTGNASFIGQSIKKGIETAVALHPEQVEIVFEDSQGSAKDAVASYNNLKLRYDPKNYIVALSSVTNALIPIVTGNDEILFSTCVSEAGITKKSDNLFRLFVNSDGDARPLADYAVESLGISRFAIVYVNDDFGIDYKNSFSDQIQKNNGVIALEESFERDEKEFRNLVTKLKANDTRFDAIYLLGYENNMGILVSKMAEQGIKKPILSIATIGQSIVREQIDKLPVIPDIYFTNTLLYDSNNVSKEKLEFLENYKSKFNEDPNYFAAFAYDLTNILVHALETGNVKESILARTHQGVMGKIVFTEAGDAEFKMVIEKYE